jgi:hypothetical protein
MRLFLGVSVACLLALSVGVADVLAQEPTNQNTNTSSSGSLNAVGINNSNLQHQTQIGSIYDSFKSFDIGISESFRIEDNDTDIASGNTVDSIVDNTDNFNANVIDNDGNAINNDGNLSNNAVDNDGNIAGNDDNLNDNVVNNDNNAIDNDGNLSGNVVDNDENIAFNDDNVITFP